MVSDSSQGPGWWQASDGKWYPPEQAPGYQTPPPGAPYGGGSYGGAPAGVDVGTALSYGWNKFIANIGDVVVIWLIYVIVTALLQWLSSRGGLFGFVMALVSFVVTSILTIALLRIGLLITAGQRPTLEAALNTDQLGPYIVAAILNGIIVTIGLVLCIIPGIIAALLLYFYGYYVLDQRQDPVQSLQSSFNLTSKNFGTVGLYALVAFVISVCTCGLAAPIMQIGAAYIYRRLNGQPVAP